MTAAFSSNEAMLLGHAAFDAADFDCLYRDHGQMIRAIVRQRGATEDAEDVTQDVFLRAWQHRGRFRGHATVRTWLTRIALNAVTDRYRASVSSRRRAEEAADLFASARPERTIVLRLALQAAIATLPPREKAILMNHYVKGVGLQQISASLNIPVGTLKSLLYRARVRLRQQLHSSNDWPVVKEAAV